MEREAPLELALLIEEWMLQNEIPGTYDYDYLKLSMSNLTWTDIIQKSDPSRPCMAKKKTVVLARMKSPLLVGEPECKVELHSGLIKYGNTGFDKKVQLPFKRLPDYILNYLSVKSLDLDLGSAVTETEPSPYLVNPEPSQEGAAAAGPVWRGRYTGTFTLMANLSGDVKIIEDDRSVQEVDFKEIVNYLEFSDLTDEILLMPEGCEWEVTGQCEFNLYS
ncbi:unnamed protein product [Lymnaea stagnalis]|uniref:Uncharacterized protein n=1 Tax=Lymnaea stagnalis TaxID=6523 RepID=A0AAV2HTZ2_LYMST